MSMKYGRLANITFIASNVPELDYAAYNSTQAYSTGDRVSVGVDNKNYHATKDINTGVIPNPANNLNGWKSMVSNRHAMFYPKISKRTENPELIEVEFNVKNTDTLSFFNLEAKEIYIEIKDADTQAVLYTKTHNLIKTELTGSSGLGDFLYSPQILQDKLTDVVPQETIDLIIQNMTQEVVDRLTANPPIFHNFNYRIEIRNPGGIAKCGMIFPTRMRKTGITLWENATTGIQSFATKERDEDWGDVELRKGDIADTMNLNVMVDTKMVGIIKQRLKEVDAEAVLWIGTNDYEFLHMIGWYQDFDISLNPENSIYNLEIESIT